MMRALRLGLRLCHGVPTATGTCRALLETARGRGGCVVAVLDERGPLLPCLHEHAFLPDLFVHGRHQDDLLLGADDVDLRVRRLPWPARAANEDSRIRRIDTLYGDRPVGLLVVSGHPDPVDVLLGAREVLASRTPPVLLLDLLCLPREERVACLRQVWRRLPEWRWHDGFLFPLDEVELAASLVEDWAESVFAVSPPDGPALPGSRTLSELAWAGWAPPASATRSDRVAFAADAPIVMTGFHRPERDGRTLRRWSGPERAARAYLPVPGFGRWTVSVSVASWGALRGPQDVLVALDGGRLAPATGSGSLLGVGTAFVGPAARLQALQLDLVCTALRPGTPDDGRRVGLCVSGFVLERQG